MEPDSLHPTPATALPVAGAQLIFAAQRTDMEGEKEVPSVSPSQPISSAPRPRQRGQLVLGTPSKLGPKPSRIILCDCVLLALVFWSHRPDPFSCSTGL